MAKRYIKNHLNTRKRSPSNISSPSNSTHESNPSISEFYNIASDIKKIAVKINEPDKYRLPTLIISIATAVLPTILSIIAICVAYSIDNASVELSIRNQQPSFSVEQCYENDVFLGYNIYNSGGEVQYLDVHLDKYIHILVSSPTKRDLFFPCAKGSEYFQAPSDAVFFPVKQIKIHSSTYPIWSPAGPNIYDTTAMINELTEMLELESIHAVFYTIDVLTLSFMNREHITYSEKYLICSRDSGTIQKNDNTFLYPLSNEMWNDILQKIPFEYQDQEYFIPFEAQNEYVHTYSPPVIFLSSLYTNLAHQIVNYILSSSE